MDIGNNKTIAEQEDEGVVVEVRNAAGEVEEGVTITVVGTYSNTYRKAQAANRDRMMKQRRGALDGEAIEQQALDTIARCIKSWAGFTSGKVNFPYTRENAVALLTSAPWTREQVEEAMNDHAAFFKKASVN